jgi:hypothetical protein
MSEEQEDVCRHELALGNGLGAKLRCSRWVFRFRDSDAEKVAGQSEDGVGLQNLSF